MGDLRKIKRALISVSNKEGIVAFAEELAKLGVEIISTGGTAGAMRKAGIHVQPVEDITGFPEMMDGRVKTLHPKIHGALLALREKEEHMAAAKMHGIEPIDLVVIDLYPFENTIETEGVSVDEAVEQIDIGGPAMIRSAAKNWHSVAVVTDRKLYPYILQELGATGGSLSLNTRQRLAALAYTRTSRYDFAISGFLAQQLSTDDLEFLEPLNPFGDLSFFEFDELITQPEPGEFKDALTIAIEKVADLRYGENPHQKAALYHSGESGGIARAAQLHGKAMSFNNYVDADAAWNLVQDFNELTCAIIKHTNPSGIGTGEDNTEAYRRALATDPVSAFGGIVAFNRRVDSEVAAELIKVFTEVVLAPEFDEAALKIFRKKKNLRVLKVENDTEAIPLDYRTISGGYLVQDRDILNITEGDLRYVSARKPTEEEVRALLLAWKACKHVKSNAIVIANQFQTVGVGAGQMNRVDSVRIAAMRAEKTDLELNKTVLASDAFFPFRDNVDEAGRFGITAIIQPGGSIRDDESIAAADEHGMAMVFTGVRHFKH